MRGYRTHPSRGIPVQSGMDSEPAFRRWEIPTEIRLGLQWWVMPLGKQWAIVLVIALVITWGNQWATVLVIALVTPWGEEWATVMVTPWG